jgi:hypothetical protein
VPERPSLVLGKNDHLASLLGEALEHPFEPRRR